MKNLPRMMIWLAAVAGGLAAASWIESGIWRAVLAFATLGVFLVPKSRLVWAGRFGDPRTHLVALLAVASLAQAAGPDLWRFVSSSEVRVWNVYHYYLGAKYFNELGYYDLYDATLAADRESENAWRRIDKVRNLRTYEVESRAVVEARYRPKDHFSEARWQTFKGDVTALQANNPGSFWSGIFRDRGYNPSPFWTVLGEALTSRVSAANPLLLKLLCSLDLLLLGATFWLVWKSFGARAAWSMVLFLSLSPVNNDRLVGGFLQFDWFCAVAAGLCLMRRGRPIPAAACFAFATLARVFPAVLVASLALPVMVRWIRRGRLARRTWVFFIAFGLFCSLGLGIGSLTHRGVGAWGDFVGNLKSHNEDHLYGQRRVGLQHVFTHDVRTLDLDEGKRERRKLFGQQKGLYVASAAVLFLFYLLVVHRRNAPDAILLGLLPFFVLAVSSRYYWGLLALLPLLARPGPEGRRRLRFIGGAQAAVFALTYGFDVSRSDRYATYSMLNMLLIGFFCLLLALYAKRDLVIFRRHRGFAPAWYQSRALALVFFVGLFFLLCFLRLPLEQAPIRDVDESVSALIAASWLEGGVPYRDAIDQRGPVTYLFYALIFAVAGVHNLWAVHWGLLLLILFVAWLLFGFSRELSSDSTGPDAGGATGASLGYLAAFLFVVASFTYRRSQMLAFHTEWPMILCHCLAMLFLWRALNRDESAALDAQRRGRWELVLAGAFYAGGFLSKQPGIFDAVAGGLFVLLWQWRRRQLVSLATVRYAGFLATGFFAVLLATISYFWLAGGLADFHLYYWSYNVDHYAKVVEWGDRLRGLDPFSHRRHYLTANPLLFAACVWQTARAISGFVRRREIDARLLIVLWFLFAYFGASYSGRNFGHYFIQILPAACLLTAWTLHDAWHALKPSTQTLGRFPDFAHVGRVGFSLGVVACLALPLQRFGGDIAWFNIHRKARVDEARRGTLEVIAEQTRAEDTIFVWGYYPELYVLSDRRPATRYSNTNYLTGMLPWENHAPGIDTSEHVVEGAWELLMDELEASKPKLVLDTAIGDHRYYGKYPITNYPRLQAFLDSGYRRTELIRDHRGNPAIGVWQRR